MNTNDEIIDIIKNLIDKNGISNNELARRVGVAKSAMSRYLNKTRQFPINKVNDFARALNTSAEHLLGFGEDDTDINFYYNQLNENRQKTVLSFTRKQLEKQNHVEENSPIYLVGQTAAGAALEYGDVMYDTITADIPTGADKALLVKGDSMEPLIKDDSIVFYKEQPIVENGEIAIIELNGHEVTCKKFYKEDGKVILKSINDKYEDMIFEDGVRIIGKVIL